MEVGHRKTKVTVVEGARDLCLARVKEDFYCLFIPQSGARDPFSETRENSLRWQ